jgi:hypothetical protein
MSLNRCLLADRLVLSWHPSALIFGALTIDLYSVPRWRGGKLFLGLVQGLTEFLPVSSSGHLVLGKYLLGLDTDAAENLTFDVFVHFGTVLSIITVYRHARGRISFASRSPC